MGALICVTTVEKGLREPGGWNELSYADTGMSMEPCVPSARGKGNVFFWQMGNSFTSS